MKFPGEDIECSSELDFTGDWNIDGIEEPLRGTLEYRPFATSFLNVYFPSGRKDWYGDEFASIGFRGSVKDFIAIIPACMRAGFSSNGYLSKRLFHYPVSSSIFLLQQPLAKEDVLWSSLNIRFNNIAYWSKITTQNFTISTIQPRNMPHRETSPSYILNEFSFGNREWKLFTALHGSETYSKGVEHSLYTMCSFPVVDSNIYLQLDKFAKHIYYSMCLLSNCLPTIKTIYYTRDESHSNLKPNMYMLPSWCNRDERYDIDQAYCMLSMDSLNSQNDLFLLTYQFIDKYEKYIKWAIDHQIGLSAVNDINGLITIFLLEEFHRNWLEREVYNIENCRFEVVKLQLENQLSDLPCELRARYRSLISFLNEMSLGKRLTRIKSLIGDSIVNIVIPNFKEFRERVVEFRNSHAHGLLQLSSTSEDTIGVKLYLQLQMFYRLMLLKHLGSNAEVLLMSAEWFGKTFGSVGYK
jgi:hypothetical protein